MMPPRNRCCADALRHSPGSISNLCSATLGAGAYAVYDINLIHMRAFLIASFVPFTPP